MTTTNQDVHRYYSGGGANANPQLSIGGAISSVRITDDTLNAVWDDTSSAEASLGDQEIRVIYFKYDGVDTYVKNVTVYLSAKAKGQDDTIEYAIDTAFGVNVVYPTRANENDPPTNVVWTNGTTRATGRLLAAKLNKGQYCHLLIRRTVDAGASPLEGEDYTLALEFDPEPGTGSGGGDTGGGDGDGDGGGGTDTSTFQLMVAVGDTGNSTDAKNTAKNFEKRISEGCRLVQFLGDYSYASSATSWTDIFKNVKSKVKALVMGNHETEDGSAALTKAYLNWIGQSKEWAKYTYGDVAVIIGSHYQSFSSGSEQYNFIKTAMKDAHDSSAINWIIFCHHEPDYTGNSDHGVDASFRDTYHPLCQTYEVDIVMYGHNHNYQRTYPLKPGPTITHQSETPNYKDPDGTIFICCGTGGRDYYATKSTPSYMAPPNPARSNPNNWQNDLFDDQNGYLLIEEQNDHGKLIGKFYDGDNNLLDSWSIAKGSGNTSGQPSATTTAQSEDTGYEAVKATDGDQTTRWRTGTNPTWIKLDLGTSKLIDFVKIMWTYYYRAALFNVETSTDNTNWTRVVPEQSSVIAQIKTMYRYNFASISARYLRINVKGNNEDDSASIYEIETGSSGSGGGTADANLTVTTMTASSDDGTQLPSFANDGNIATYWRGGNSSGVDWLKADLGSTKSVGLVKIGFYVGSPPDGRIYTFNVEVSTDNSSWTPALANDDNSLTTGALETFNFATHVNARYVRLNFVTNTQNGRAGCNEFDVWGS